MISALSDVNTDLIGSNVTIDDYCVIKENVIIGNNVTIHPHVVIYEGVFIGENVEIFPGAIIGKAPSTCNVLSRQPHFNKTVEIGKDSSIGPNSIIYYDTIIGSQTLIGDAVIIREKSTIGNKCILGVKVSLNYNVSVGDETVIMASSHITGNSIIGKNVFVSVGVCTANDNNFGSEGYSEQTIKGQVIGDHAKIGEGAILLPGIHIGELAVVAAGSVVTKDVMANFKVKGIPAKPYA